VAWRRQEATGGDHNIKNGDSAWDERLTWKLWEAPNSAQIKSSAFHVHTNDMMLL
jgi:hypothetical protein